MFFCSYLVTLLADCYAAFAALMIQNHIDERVSIIILLFTVDVFLTL